MLIFPSKLCRRPSMLESESESISEINFAREESEARDSASEISEGASSTVGRIIICCFRDCQTSCDLRCFGVTRSSASEPASIDVAVEIGRRFVFFIDIMRAM